MLSEDILIVCSLSFIWFEGFVVMAEQLNWTPIHYGGANQVDMWTRKSSGCECEFDPSRSDCACCIKPGGCQCGSVSPNKCAQCGLHQYCDNKCNITINQRSIFSESKSTVGQIKSPSLQGPALCWYLFEPESGYRLEIQLYRLVNVGHFNGTGCQLGSVHFADEINAKSDSIGVQICGENERFTPPIVLFSDKGSAILTLRIHEATKRSQFLALYSFTAFNNSQGVGFRPRGGKRIENTVCDWLYQDFTCITLPGGCTLASPGFPGLYPANSTCNYHITTSSLRTKVRIVFVSLSLPLNRCATDYINIYQGPSSSNLLLTTLCSNKKQELIFSGPNLLIKFKSEVLLPPYDYNGFVARLEFVDRSTTTESSLFLTQTRKSSGKNTLNSQGKSTGSREITSRNSSTMASSSSNQIAERYCTLYILSNNTRSGHFDTRTFPENCTSSIIIFSGQLTDLIHISLFNYRLNGSHCQSFVEIIDGNIQTQVFKLLKKVCGPRTKYARNSEGRFHEQQTFLSSSNALSIYFVHNNKSENEYVDGAYTFLDEYAEGTIQPDTLCDVTFYGLTSSSMGRIQNHGAQHSFWNIEGALRCSQRFVPTTNQSITLRISSLQRLSSKVCETRCGDSGCQCSSTANGKYNASTSFNYDHLLILDEHNVTLSCICGPFREEWLPIVIRSWTPISIVYSLARYSWSEKGFSFEAEYKFEYDNVCGHHELNQYAGVIQSAYIPDNKELNYYYNQLCTWVLNSRVERQVLIDVQSLQNRPCSAWNISFYEHIPDNRLAPDALLHEFCPRDGRKSFKLSTKLNSIVIKLAAMTRTSPKFQIEWRSQVAQTHTKLSVSIPEASSTTCNLFSSMILNNLFAVILSSIIYFKSVLIL